MKITYDYRIFSNQRYGGISRYFFEVAKRIGRIPGVEASVLAPLFVNNYLLAKEGPKVRGMHLARRPGWAAASVDWCNYQASKIALKSQHTDILHETYYGEKGLGICRNANVTTVYDMIHEKFPDLHRGDNTPRLKAASVQRADHIFCISRKTQEDLVEILGVDEAKTSVVHLGCDFGSRIGEVNPNVRPEPYLFFVGPRGGHKNFRTLVAAYASSSRLVRDFQVVAFGSTPFGEAELAEFTRLGVLNRIAHVGGDDALLPTLYAHAHLFVYPSLYEGFGFPPLEAMALGGITIASQAGSMPEILGSAAAYFDPESAENLRGLLERFAYQGSDDRNSWLVKGRAQAAKYSWDDCAEKTLAVYRNFSS